MHELMMSLGTSVLSRDNSENKSGVTEKQSTSGELLLEDDSALPPPKLRNYEHFHSSGR